MTAAATAQVVRYEHAERRLGRRDGHETPTLGAAST
jgi:hypothetical protein